VTPQSREIILQMLERNPEKRLALMDLMEMDFFSQDDETF
jgi:hypothetical protein